MSRLALGIVCDPRTTVWNPCLVWGRRNNGVNMVALVMRRGNRAPSRSRLLPPHVVSYRTSHARGRRRKGGRRTPKHPRQPQVKPQVRYDACLAQDCHGGSRAHVQPPIRRPHLGGRVGPTRAVWFGGCFPPPRKANNTGGDVSCRKQFHVFGAIGARPLHPLVKRATRGTGILL